MSHSRDSGELSENDLEQVAGGGTMSFPKKPGNPDLPPSPEPLEGGKKKEGAGDGDKKVPPPA